MNESNAGVQACKVKIETSFIRKLKVINVLSHRELVKLRNAYKKCNFASCISKIVEEAPCEFQFTSFSFNTLLYSSIYSQFIRKIK